MRIIKKHSKKIFLLVFMCLMFIVQVKAQFFEGSGGFDYGEGPDGAEGPGGFDDPPPNDVPLDSYQWIMLVLALAYGAYIFWKHYQKTKKSQAGSSIQGSLPALSTGQSA